MRKTFGLSLLALAVAFAAVLVAIEKPPKDLQDLMKSNGSIVDISLGIERAAVDAKGAAVAPPSLKAHVKAKDYDGIASDAATLKANFTKVEAFWTQRNIDDAIKISKAAVKASADLEAAAKAKDDVAISSSANAVAATCRDCHQAHRLMQLTDKTFLVM